LLAVDLIRNSRRIRALAVLLWALGSPAFASDPQAAAVATTPTPAVAPPAVLPPERHWRLGVAAGYGERSNPLIQSDDIPVIIDIDLAWFGKRWFFDNGDLGFSVVDNDLFTTNLVARVNSDRAFFSKTNTRYVTFTRLGGGALAPAVDGEGEPLVAPVALDPPDRSYAVELGLETLLGGRWGAASFRAFHDVSKAHRGYEISASYDYRFTRGRFSIAPSVGVAYKDDDFTDYYWGVHADEASFVLPRYEATGGLSWEAGLRGSFYLTEHLRIAASANYERLQHSVARSPLVEESYVFGYFAGVAWTF
jgi:outer membrane protein